MNVPAEPVSKSRVIQFPSRVHGTTQVAPEILALILLRRIALDSKELADCLCEAKLDPAFKHDSLSLLEAVLQQLASLGDVVLQNAIAAAKDLKSI